MLSPWCEDFWNQKKRHFHLKCHIFVLNRYFTLTKRSMKSGSSNLPFPTDDEQSSSRNIWKVRNTRFYPLFLLKFSNFLVGKPPFLQTCVIIHLYWVFFLSEWDEIRKSNLGFSFCRDLIISRVFLFTGNLIVSYIFSDYFLDLILRLLRNLYHFFELLVIKPPISIVHLRNQIEHITFISSFRTAPTSLKDQ